MFKWRQTEPGLILCAVRWYLRYSLSFRDVEELLREPAEDGLTPLPSWTPGADWQAPRDSAVSCGPDSGSLQFLSRYRRCSPTT